MKKSSSLRGLVDVFNSFLMMTSITFHSGNFRCLSEEGFLPKTISKLGSGGEV